METVTEAEFNLQQLESLQSNQVAYNVRGFDEVRNSISKWSQENHSFCKFASGIEVSLDDERIYQDYGLKNDHDDLNVLVSKFFLSGNQRVISPGIENVDTEYSETSGHNYLFYLPDIEETEQFFTGTPLQIVRINIDLAFLKSFVKDLDLIPKKIQPLIERDLAPLFHTPVGKVTPMMRTIIKQMWEHPYQGAIARMYLEGKVLELLALQLSQLLKLEQNQPIPPKLNPKDIDRLYQAKNILQQNYLQPPSVIELAQQVELNRIKLQQGFRQVFQNTPFGYLQSYRLDLARIMLQESELTVSTVAISVGYSNVSYFSRTFKQKFGITPGQSRSGKNIF